MAEEEFVFKRKRFFRNPAFLQFFSDEVYTRNEREYGHCLLCDQSLPSRFLLFYKDGSVQPFLRHLLSHVQGPYNKLSTSQLEAAWNLLEKNWTEPFFCFWFVWHSWQTSRWLSVHKNIWKENGDEEFISRTWAHWALWCHNPISSCWYLCKCNTRCFCLSPKFKKLSTTFSSDIIALACTFL